jgi:hypothetical protein
VAAPGTDVFVCAMVALCRVGDEALLFVRFSGPFFLKNGVVLYGFWARFSS